jgi:glutamate--cysteine ligase
MAEREQLRRDVPQEGMKARVRGRRVGELARELVAIARAGLAHLDGADLALLDPIARIAADERTVADEIRALHAAHGGASAPLIEALALPLPG